MANAAQTTSGAPAVEIHGLGFRYNGAAVLEDVCFAIAPHEAACIVGPNGGGKTTLVRLILGLLRPTAGEIRVFGLPPHQARLRIGYMPQHLTYDPKFPVTVLDIVVMGRLGRPGIAGFLGHYSTRDRRAAVDALEQMGVGELHDRPFAELSGGQRQRVLIARAVCSEPDLLLLDEPTANVDSTLEARLMEILRQLNRRMTVVMVSHDLGVVSRVAEKVICVNRRVHVHPTAELTGEVIRDLYGGEVRAVHHGDHDQCGGCTHD